MAATCGAGAMWYIIPMLLGRTYDMQTSNVGIDIFNQEDIERAKQNPIPNPEVTSNYMTIERSSEKRDFIGISGELGIKIKSGLLDIRGAGEYLKDTSNVENTVEIMIKMTFSTVIREIHLDAKPLTFWQALSRQSVGTHVVSAITYGGEVYASVNFVAHKSEYLEDIKAQISGSISKSGAFDINAQGKLEKIAQNISSKAKMEIDYYATVPLEGVPTTIQGLRQLVSHFREQVEKINNGIGVPVCVTLRPLSDFESKFEFLKNQELVNSLDDFNYLFDNLREAKTILKNLVTSLPQAVTESYMNKVIDFSGRLTKTLTIFNDVIGNLDLEKGSQQLTPAETAFDLNSKLKGESRYTKEVKQLVSEKNEKEDPNQPRGIYVRWGKTTCGLKASNALYIGFMTSLVDEGIGAGTNYQCLPENPDTKVDPNAIGVDPKGSKLAIVRYKSLSMFQSGGTKVEGKSAACVVCETPMRPTVAVFTAVTACPGDWVQEYTGYLVSSAIKKNRAETICLDYDPDTKELNNPPATSDPIVLPIKMGSEGVDASIYITDASLPCAVCSK